MKKISFVIPCYASGMTIQNVIDELKETIHTDGRYDYEVIMVNDCSPDNTYEIITNICRENSNMLGINLAKNFGQHAALMAGFNHISGEVIVCLDDDGQTPANEVFKLIEKIEAGYDVVYASYENKKHTLIRNMGSNFNRKMTESLLDKPKDLYISSYFAVRRFIIDHIVEYQHSYPYVIGLVLRTTKNITNVPINHKEREHGTSGYTMKKLLSLWINGFTAFSVKPLRIATFSGSFVAMLGFLYTLYTIINKLINPEVPLGWSSTMAAVMLIGGLILLVLGMVGEYIGRLYMCINNAPQYIIRETTKDDTEEKNNEEGM